LKSEIKALKSEITFQILVISKSRTLQWKCRTPRTKRNRPGRLTVLTHSEYGNIFDENKLPTQALASRAPDMVQAT